MDPRSDRLIRYAGAFAPDVVASASGSFVETVDGRRILDFTAGQICATVGHNHPRVVAAIEEACRSVLHLNAWTLSEPVLQLADRLVGYAPCAARAGDVPQLPGERASRRPCGWPSSRPAVSRWRR